MGNKKVGPFRVITYYAHCIGIYFCLASAIWDSEDSIKWVCFAIYMHLTGKFFGVNYKDEKVKGSYIVRPYKELNFYNLKGQ